MKKKVPWLTKNEWIYFFDLYEQDFIKFKKEYSERKNIVINRKHLYYFRIKYKEYIMNNQKIKKPKSIDNDENYEIDIDKLDKNDLIKILKHYRNIVKNKRYDKKDEEITKEIIKKSSSSCRQLSILFPFSKSSINRIKNDIKTNKIPKNIERNNLIEEIFHEYYDSIGRKPLAKIFFNKTGILISDRHIGRIMNKMHLFCNIRIKKSHNLREIKNTTFKMPNIVNRDYDNKYIDKSIIATDITYIESPKDVDNKYVFLSIFISHKTKEILNYSLSKNNNLDLVLNSLPQDEILKYSIVHSDHGVFYTSHKFKSKLIKNNCIQSMSRIGNSLDNRVAEHFFATIKTELINKLKMNKINFDELKCLIDEYIFYYNNKRIQEKLSWLSPINYKNNML